MFCARQLLPSLSALLRQSAVASTSQTFQCRQKITVPVTQGNVDRAVKTLLRKVIQGKITKEWKARQYFVRPAQQRVLDAKESRQRLAKKRFKAMMAAIAARQARGF